MALAQTITTVAGGGQPARESGGLGGLGAIARVAVDSTGNVYASDLNHHVVWKISAEGALSVLAGNGTSGFSGDFGPAAQAQLNVPTGLAVDAAGNVFVADSSNHRVRKIALDGSISTVAGNGKGGFAGDGGQATQASLQIPQGLAVDGRGNLYIADMYNQRIRKVDREGVITTICGTGQPGYGGDGGPADQATINSAAGVAVDKSGNIYVVDTDNHRVRKITSDGKISTVAGAGAVAVPVPAPGQPRGPFYERPEFTGDGGPAVGAHLNQPVSAAVDSSGNLYITDTANQRIRKVDERGVISTVSGTGGACFSGEGRAASTASLSEPAGIAVDALGNIYIADTDNQRVRKITNAGNIVTIAGTGGLAQTGDGGPATAATLDQPEGLAVDPSTGDLYIADSGNQRLRKVGADGVIRTVAGTGTGCYSGDEGLAVDAALNRPRGVAVDSGGAIYVADSGNARVRRVDPQGSISTIFGQGYFRYSGDPVGAAAVTTGQRRQYPGQVPSDETLSEPWALAVDDAGHVFVSEAGAAQVRQINVGGSQSVVAKDLHRPSGLAWDPDAGLFIADTEGQVIRRLDLGGNISVVAGTGARGFGGDGEAATKAMLNIPKGLAVDGAGNLYIADDLNQRIRRVTPDGKISTVAGRGTQGFAGDNGPATKAALFRPSAVAVDAFGNLYIADTLNNRIRKVSMPASFAAVPAAVDLTGALNRTVRLRASNPALTWQAKASEPWVRLSATQGAFPFTLTVSADPSLAAGDHTATIEFTSPNATPPAFTVTVVIRKQ